MRGLPFQHFNDWYGRDYGFRRDPLMEGFTNTNRKATSCLFFRKNPSPSSELEATAFYRKSRALPCFSVGVCSGGRIRTSDLRVMSPTSCLCSTPHPVCETSKGKISSEIGCKDNILFLCMSKKTHFFSLWNTEQVM